MRLNVRHRARQIPLSGPSSVHGQLRNNDGTSVTHRTSPEQKPVMDPLSITASVVGLTSTCVMVAKKLHDIKDKYSFASLTISAICTEATIISASLSRIQSIILESPTRVSQSLSNRPDLESTLDQALIGCYVVFDVLQGEVRKLTGEVGDEPGLVEYGRKAKAKYVWHESSMQDILNHMRGLQTALTLLLQLLGTDTMSEMKQIMENNTAVLTKLMERNQTFRHQRVSQAPQSIFDMSFVVQSIHEGDGGSVFSNTFFAFDDDVVDSQAYRRVLANAYAKNGKVPSSSSSETATIARNGHAESSVPTGAARASA